MPSLKVAAVAHVFYQEQWPELAGYLRNIRQEFVLYVSIPDFSTADIEILKDFPAARVVRVPNVGRDVAPFIRLLPELQSFDVVCKIHTKRNVETSGVWREELLRGVLGSRRLVGSILAAFETYPEMVLAGPRSLYLDGPMHTYGTGALMAEYFGTVPERYGFFGGTMFWVRPSLLNDFPVMMPLTDFVQHEEIDDHSEHAIERLFGARAALTAGAKIGLVSENWFGRPHIEIVPATTAGNRNIVRALRRIGRRRRFESPRLQRIFDSVAYRRNYPE